MGSERQSAAVSASECHRVSASECLCVPVGESTTESQHSENEGPHKIFTAVFSCDNDRVDTNEVKKKEEKKKRNHNVTERKAARKPYVPTNIAHCGMRQYPIRAPILILTATATSVVQNDKDPGAGVWT